jgi:hypothetical protein
MKLPCASPVNTSPPSVDSTPDHVGDGCFHSHFNAPVRDRLPATRPKTAPLHRSGSTRCRNTSGPFKDLRRGAENVALLPRRRVKQFRLRIISGEKHQRKSFSGSIFGS